MFQEVRSEKKLDVKKFFELKSIIIYVLSILIGIAKLPSGATPFGLALLGAFADTGFPLVIPLLLIGITTGISFGGVCLLKFVIASLLYITMKSFIKGNSKTGNAAKMLFATAISETIILLLSETLIYDAVMAAFMSTTTAIFYLIFSEGLPILLEYDERKITSYETLMASGILLTVVASCLGQVQIVGLSLRNIFCILIVLYLGWRQGATCGIVAGISVSLVLGIMGYANGSIVATYAICGLLSGILSRYGKVGAIIGFVLGNAIWAFYINASTEVIIPIGEIIIASVVLFFLPKRITHFIDNLFEFDNILEGRDPIALLAESTIYKLKSVSDVAKDMASNVENETNSIENETNMFVKTVKENTCEKCSQYRICWGKNYHTTFEQTFNALEKLKKKNQLQEKDIAKSECKNKNNWLMGLNHAFEIYKTEKNWNDKIQENKKMVAKQLRGVSKAIENVQEEIKEKQSSKEDINLLGIGLKLEVAMQKKTKNNHTVSGDNLIYQKLKNGKTLVGISDGMGSGEFASKGSQKVLELLEKYLDAGLDRKVAIDLINSYMMLGADNEQYSTLDVMLFDEMTGNVELLKYGASPTYLLEEGTVKMITSKSLPIGSVMNIEGDNYQDKLERETIIVMVSDGMIEANNQKELWIKNLLESLQTREPKKISEMILQEALENNLGIAKDDMSIIVIKVC